MLLALLVNPDYNVYGTYCEVYNAMKTVMKIVETVCLAVLFLALATVLRARIVQPQAVMMIEPTATIEPAASVSPSPSPTPSPTPTPEPTPTPTPEPTPEFFTISAVGDCTLNSSPNFVNSPSGYNAYLNGDFAYPFSHTVQYFETDELTLANLECCLSDQTLYSSQQFSFLCPTEYANILLEGGVDFVTTANNHMMDFGQTGVEDTYAALENYGMPYGKEGEAQIITTPNGIAVGIYCDYNSYSPQKSKCVATIEQLKADGADYIICMFHWGVELYYSPNAAQIELAHACIDAGADLIYGSHSHCLQPIELYNDGIILYSLGNWTFGGSTMPSDQDTVIAQITIKRDLDGTITNEGIETIPCRISGQPKENNYTNYNDYRPTPYEEGTEDYERVLSKLDGTFQPTSQGADYSNYYASWGQ